VKTLVFAHIGVLSEGSGTMRADKWTLPTMYTLVVFKVLLLREILPTLRKAALKISGGRLTCRPRFNCLRKFKGVLGRLYS
jgi:hypothetical protein